MERETKNAIIKSASIDMERGVTSWIHLDYGGCGQGFGGFILSGKYLHLWVTRVCEVVGVDAWSGVVGKPVRVIADHGKVHAIGHFLEDKWFYPSEEFDAERHRDGIVT